MRPDLDPDNLETFDVICWGRFAHPNAFGGFVEPADYDGYKHTTPDGKVTMLLSTRRGDLSADWLDVTNYQDTLNFIPRPKIA